ncbi:trypsin-like peptidase domain-containing protein [Catellatospora sp. KI3]|uniref:S1C family serine protease n=1 Tax=Catellatospora sp. KI3 TaxID=3041620 RepID=UPI0024825033|nr:trypsin-like peptidase domain-containing protein [Catellatospora sp. KI3]MDI1460167.1 trypsin-like peptidase domain-containing protein [Catellatospora sp. KI3]
MTEGWVYRRPDDEERAAAHSTPPAAAPASHWWSDALNDPWRDPHSPATVSPAAQRPHQPSPEPLAEPDHTRRRTLWTVAGAAVLAGVLAGVLGGALGVRFSDDPVTVRSVLGAPSTSAVQRAPDSLAAVARMVLPSVVTVRVPVDGSVSLGSGFVVSSTGYVVTNDHVVSGGSGVATVVFDDGSTSPAKLVGADPESDVAVLQIQGKHEVTPAALGDSDSVAVGDAVVAVGSPLALRGTVTAGIVSALDRPIATAAEDGTTRYYAAIQTDAAVNHGNSGGPLVDAAGQVVGINAVIKSMAGSEESAGNIGLAFAIPINHARRVADEIIAEGRAHRTVIGAEIGDASRGPGGGVKLGQVVALGPAAEAGMRSGDVVVAYGGHLIGEPTDLVALVRKTAPGDVVKVTYKRGSTRHDTSVTLVADAD